MKIIVAGGAGFIGSHLVDRLMRTTEHEIVVFDNFSSGALWRLHPHATDPRLRIAEGDLKDREAITAAMEGVARVYHFASNPDIAKAMTNPDVDFWEGTYLTQNLLEAMRARGAQEIFFASGSGVYGDVADFPVTEDFAPLLPISPYGASKLACEAMIHAYSHMFGMRAHVFRFANVVGPRQTHGVAYDFIHRLRHAPGTLQILGDGTQSKSYIHVDDIVSGIEHFAQQDRGRYHYYHLATTDYLTVREIADMVVQAMQLPEVVYSFAGGPRGWSGDVPVVRFNLAKAHHGGWSAQHSSRQAMEAAIAAMLSENSPNP